MLSAHTQQQPCNSKRRSWSCRNQPASRRHAAPVMAQATTHTPREAYAASAKHRPRGRACRRPVLRLLPRLLLGVSYGADNSRTFAVRAVRCSVRLGRADDNLTRRRRNSGRSSTTPTSDAATAAATTTGATVASRRRKAGRVPGMELSSCSDVCLWGQGLDWAHYLP